MSNENSPWESQRRHIIRACEQALSTPTIESPLKQNQPYYPYIQKRQTADKRQNIFLQPHDIEQDQKREKTSLFSRHELCAEIEAKYSNMAMQTSAIVGDDQLNELLLQMSIQILQNLFQHQSTSLPQIIKIDEEESTFTFQVNGEQGRRRLLQVAFTREKKNQGDKYLFATIFCEYGKESLFQNYLKVLNIKNYQLNVSSPRGDQNSQYYAYLFCLTDEQDTIQSFLENRKSQIRMEEFARINLSLLRALCAMHSRGVYNGELSTDTVLLVQGSCVILNLNRLKRVKQTLNIDQKLFSDDQKNTKTITVSQIDDKMCNYCWEGLQPITNAHISYMSPLRRVIMSEQLSPKLGQDKQEEEEEEEDHFKSDIYCAGLLILRVILAKLGLNDIQCNTILQSAEKVCAVAESFTSFNRFVMGSEDILVDNEAKYHFASIENIIEQILKIKQQKRISSLRLALLLNLQELLIDSRLTDPLSSVFMPRVFESESDPNEYRVLYAHNNIEYYGGLKLIGKSVFKHGQGKVYQENALIYDGILHEDLPHQQGTLALFQGFVYSGTFHNGFINGFGKIFFASTDKIIFQGLFFQNLPCTGDLRLRTVQDDFAVLDEQQERLYYQLENEPCYKNLYYFLEKLKLYNLRFSKAQSLTLLRPFSDLESLPVEQNSPSVVLSSPHTLCNQQVRDSNINSVLVIVIDELEIRTNIVHLNWQYLQSALIKIAAKRQQIIKISLEIDESSFFESNMKEYVEQKYSVFQEKFNQIILLAQKFINSIVNHSNIFAVLKLTSDRPETDFLLLKSKPLKEMLELKNLYLTLSLCDQSYLWQQNQKTEQGLELQNKSLDFLRNSKQVQLLYLKKIRDEDSLISLFELLGRNLRELEVRILGGLEVKKFLTFFSTKFFQQRIQTLKVLKIDGFYFQAKKNFFAQLSFSQQQPEIVTILTQILQSSVQELEFKNSDLNLKDFLNALQKCEKESALRCLQITACPAINALSTQEKTKLAEQFNKNIYLKNLTQISLESTKRNKITCIHTEIDVPNYIIGLSARLPFYNLKKILRNETCSEVYCHGNSNLQDNSAQREISQCLLLQAIGQKNFLEVRDLNLSNFIVSQQVLFALTASPYAVNLQTLDLSNYLGRGVEEFCTSKNSLINLKKLKVSNYLSTLSVLQTLYNSPLLEQLLLFNVAIDLLDLRQIDFTHFNQEFVYKTKEAPILKKLTVLVTEIQLFTLLPIIQPHDIFKGFGVFPQTRIKPPFKKNFYQYESIYKYLCQAQTSNSNLQIVNFRNFLVQENLHQNLQITYQDKEKIIIDQALMKLELSGDGTESQRDFDSLFTKYRFSNIITLKITNLNISMARVPNIYGVIEELLFNNLKTFSIKELDLSLSQISFAFLEKLLEVLRDIEYLDISKAQLFQRGHLEPFIKNKQNLEKLKMLVCFDIKLQTKVFRSIIRTALPVTAKIIPTEYDEELKINCESQDSIVHKFSNISDSQVKKDLTNITQLKFEFEQHGLLLNCHNIIDRVDCDQIEVLVLKLGNSEMINVPRNFLTQIKKLKYLHDLTIELNSNDLFQDHLVISQLISTNFKHLRFMRLDFSKLGLQDEKAIQILQDLGQLYRLESLELDFKNNLLNDCANELCKKLQELIKNNIFLGELLVELRKNLWSAENLEHLKNLQSELKTKKPKFKSVEIRYQESQKKSTTSRSSQIH